ncbi:hypothetical protein JVU11DRAFT_1373 [Chiua virens]|nr:hypothetical protein JVU11DRAFT_1373 [Chiua virens]
MSTTRKDPNVNASFIARMTALDTYAHRVRAGPQIAVRLVLLNTMQAFAEPTLFDSPGHSTTQQNIHRLTSPHRAGRTKRARQPRTVREEQLQQLERSSSFPRIFSGMPVLPVDTNVDLPPDAQDRQQHERVARDRECHRPHNRTRRKCPAQRRRTLLWLMLTSKSPDRAWAAYQELLSYRVAIPHHLLHQLLRLLASVKPRTGTVYLQLLSVLKTLQKNGGRIRSWEWNTLIDSAGKQWHKTRLEDYENSLDIFNKKGVLPTGNAVPVNETLDPEVDSCITQQEPDIWTYNILLSIASRSNSPLTIRHASSLLLASGLPPNRYTHLCLLRYFAARNDLRSVRSTLCKMKQQDLEVGLDGINACLWAYARNGRFDVALRIYQILRSNIRPRPNLEEHDIEEDSRYIRDTVGLDVQDTS